MRLRKKRGVLPDDPCQGVPQARALDLVTSRMLGLGGEYVRHLRLEPVCSPIRPLV